jgi:hypothetical protein
METIVLSQPLELLLEVAGVAVSAPHLQLAMVVLVAVLSCNHLQACWSFRLGLGQLVKDLMEGQLFLTLMLEVVVVLARLETQTEALRVVTAFNT